MLTQFTQYLQSTLTPGVAGNMLWATIYILVIFAGISLCVVFINWGERKALAHFQIRLGPMRVGPHGLLQPIADALKLLLKEDTIPANADTPKPAAMSSAKARRAVFRVIRLPSYVFPLQP